MGRLIRELIDVPERVHRGDFVLRLTEGIRRAESTLRDYVLTGQLVGCFDAALDTIRNATENRSSRAAYLHGSFGCGKSHFMAVLHLLLAGDARARSIPELAPVVERHRTWMDRRRFLLVPFHMIGAKSMESAVLGGYVEYVRALHPEAPIPAVYLTDTVFANARNLRAKIGDETFFSILNAGNQAGGSGWGALEAGWNAETFDAAMAAPPLSDERAHLLNDLVTHLLQAYREVALAGAGEAFVPFEEGLYVLSAHAKSLGYDALILFLDELILWLASHMAEPAFVAREVGKVVKLVEAAKFDRPVPVVSFVARQRDLRDLVGEHIPGVEQLAFADELKHWEGRFSVITLEDRNLPAIAEKRVLRPKSEAARREIDADFERTTKVREEVLGVLLTSEADRSMFRKVYPFSPAFLQALVALSSALQRERTALKVMVQLLSNQRETLALGQVIPVGDLYDVIAEGDEPFGEVMRLQFENAKRLYHTKLLPLLEQHHGVTWQQTKALAPEDPKLRSFRNDDRLVKTLLLAALVPEVEAFRGMTATRLAALNHGTIRAPIDGQDAGLVLAKVRQWASQVGEIRVSEEPRNPTIAMQLSGVDTEAILEKARIHDNAGNWRLEVRKILFRELGLENTDQLFLEHSFPWCRTRRQVDVVFGNVRELPFESFRAPGDHWKAVIDFPFDEENYSPADDVRRLEEFRRERGSLRTVCWIPAFFTRKVRHDLRTLVVLEHVLFGERLRDYGSHLSEVERAQARALLDNRRSQLRQVILSAMNAAYGLPGSPSDLIDPALAPEASFQSLEPSFRPVVPAAAGLGAAFAQVLDQMLRHQYPAHPRFEGNPEEEIRPSHARRVLEEIRNGLRTANGDRIEVEKTMRVPMRQVAQPLRLGTMYESAFVLDHHWEEHFDRQHALEGGEWTVSRLRGWFDKPEPMGLPPHLQNLVILLFAERTNRSFHRHGAAFTPSIDDLPDEVELRQERLPAEAEWARAIEVGAKVFGVAGSPMCSAGNLAEFCGNVVAAAKGLEQAARGLPGTVRDRLRWIEGDATGAARLRTAAVADGLVRAIIGAKREGLVGVLAAFTAPTSLEAMGTSLQKAGEVIAAIERTEFEILEAVFSLADARQVRAREIRARLKEALEADEFAVAVGPRLRAAQSEAVGLLKVIESPPPPEPPPPPPPPPPPGRVHERGSQSGVGQKEGLATLRRLVRTVEEDPSAQVTLTWDIDLRDRKP